MGWHLAGSSHMVRVLSTDFHKGYVVGGHVATKAQKQGSAHRPGGRRRPESRCNRKRSSSLISGR